MTKWKLYFPSPFPSSLIMHELWIMSRRQFFEIFLVYDTKQQHIDTKRWFENKKIHSIVLKQSQRNATSIKVPFSKKPFENYTYWNMKWTASYWCIQKPRSKTWMIFSKLSFWEYFRLEKNPTKGFKSLLVGAFLITPIFCKSQMRSIKITPMLGKVVTNYPYWPENWPNLHVTFSNRDGEAKNSIQKARSAIIAANGTLKLEILSPFRWTNINRNKVIVVFWSLKLAQKGRIFTFSAISY